MAYDQYGNYIPDAFGGQPVALPPMNPSMNVAMNPQMAGAANAQAANAPAPNMSPVAAPQRPSIQPMGMPSMGGGQSQPTGDQSFGLSSLAHALRSGSKDKDSKIKDLTMGQRWDNTMNGLYKIGDKFGSMWDSITS